MKALQKIFFCLVPFQVVVLTFFLIQVARRHVTCRLPPQADISCHFLRSPVHLPPFVGPEGENDLQSPPLTHETFLETLLLPDEEESITEDKIVAKNIYYHETSCRGGLTLHQACSVESASRNNPHWTVYVLFSAPIRNDHLLDILTYRPNVKFRRVYIEDHVKRTPIEELMSSGRFNRTLCTYSQAADMLRLATLFKYPGLYLDLDMVVTRSLHVLGENWAVREDDQRVFAGVLDFGGDDVGRSIAREAAEELASTYTHDTRRNSADAITRVLNRRCNTSHPKQMHNKNCKGFMVYSPEISVPASKGEDPDIFFAYEELMHRFSTHMIHFYQQHDRCAGPSKDHVYSTLASMYCPKVHENYPDQFPTTLGYLD